MVTKPVGGLSGIHCLRIILVILSQTTPVEDKKKNIASPTIDSQNTPRTELPSNHMLLDFSLSAADSAVAS